VKNRKAQCLCGAELISPEAEQEDSAQYFCQKRNPDYGHQKPANLTHGLYIKDVLHQSLFPHPQTLPQQKSESCAVGHDPETPNLKQGQNERLPQIRPGCRCIDRDEPGNTDPGGSGK